jgi:Xaa-Pro aminopeptidase
MMITMTNLNILEKATNAIQDEQIDVLLTFGADNSQYLSGAILPFNQYRLGQIVAVVLFSEADPLCICPAEWESSIRETSWIKKIIPYRSGVQDAATVVSILGGILGQLENKRPIVGFDRQRASTQLEELLVKEMPAVDWRDCSSLLSNLRMVKTPDETTLLETVAEMTDHAINGAIHHVTVDRRTTALTLAEELRVHSQERGVDLIGYHATARVASHPEDLSRMWHFAPRFGYSRTNDFLPGETVRMEIKIVCRVTGQMQPAS